jgi:hypothetical protein
LRHEERIFTYDSHTTRGFGHRAEVATGSKVVLASYAIAFWAPWLARRAPSFAQTRCRRRPASAKGDCVPSWRGAGYRGSHLWWRTKRRHRQVTALVLRSGSDKTLIRHVDIRTLKGGRSHAANQQCRCDLGLVGPDATEILGEHSPENWVKKVGVRREVLEEAVHSLMGSQNKTTKRPISRSIAAHACGLLGSLKQKQALRSDPSLTISSQLEEDMPVLGRCRLIGAASAICAALPPSLPVFKL